MIDIGSAIGPYKVTKKLGEDRMGAVFSASHETNDRQVKIKVLHPEYAKVQELTSRFLNEARAVNRIDHPGVVKVSDFGQLPDGTAYIVMESVRGESMAEMIKQAGGPLPLAKALNYSTQLAATLAIAHEKGIVHRDIKPDNVLIVSDLQAPGAEQTKLLDFGIAKLTADANAAGVKTRTSAIMGTPHYMSPEQCKGGKNVDEKSDVYSFGVLLFVMLTGSYPFDGEGVGDIIDKHLFEPPPSARSVAPDVPDSLSQLITRLLAKNKDDRPKMHEVRAALSALQRSAPPLESDAQKQVGRTAPAEPRYTSALPIIPPPRPAVRMRLLLRISVVGLLIGSPLAAWLALRGTVETEGIAADGSAKGAGVQPRMIELRVDSIPTGAEVIRKSDGSVLGRTPLTMNRPASAEELVISLRLLGYAERELRLSLTADSRRSEVLTADEAPVIPTVPTNTRGKKRKKDKQDSTLDEPTSRRRADDE